MPKPKKTTAVSKPVGVKHDPRLPPPSPSMQLIRLDPQALISQAIDQESGVEIMERLFTLQKEVRKEQARELWYISMAAFQKSCPAIRKDEKAEIQGRYSYKFASLGGIMRTVLPVMGPLGLSVTWRQRFESAPEGLVIVNCRVSHTAGHFEESGELPVPTSQGSASGMGANPAQRIGIAQSYGRRYTLMAVLGIAPEDDTDAAPLTDNKPSEEAQLRSDGTLWTGVVTGIEAVKQGDKTLYKVSGNDGKVFGTYDEGIADQANSFKKTAEMVDLALRKTRGGGRIITGIIGNQDKGADTSDLFGGDAS